MLQDVDPRQIGLQEVHQKVLFCVECTHLISWHFDSLGENYWILKYFGGPKSKKISTFLLLIKIGLLIGHNKGVQEGLGWGKAGQRGRGAISMECSNDIGYDSLYLHSFS